VTSRISAYLSDPAFQEIVGTPQIRVFRLLGAMPLVSGPAPLTGVSGPDPGGRVAFHSETAQSVDVALPFLRGWRGDVAVSEHSGRLRVEAPARSATHLNYAPPLFVPGLWIAFAGVSLGAFLLARPAILAVLLKTRQIERK
jgi:hypothetical protein